MANKVEANVAKMVEELKKNPSARFSKSDFQGLVYAILADKDFDTKKYVIKNDEMVEVHSSMNAAMAKFMDKLLKHAQMSDSTERARVIESFEFGPRDIEWIADAVDEAMYTNGVHSKQVEGNSNSTWILMDYQDIIVHLFSKEDRLFYDLERIWKDGHFMYKKIVSYVQAQ